MINDHLARAERHVAQGEQHILRQRELIDALQRKGDDTSLAEDLLRRFEETQRMHIADRDRLRSALKHPPEYSWKGSSVAFEAPAPKCKKIE
jgi:hypothetical protein